MKFVFHAILFKLFTAKASLAHLCYFEANLILASLDSNILLCVHVNTMVFALQIILYYMCMYIWF